MSNIKKSWQDKARNAVKTFSALLPHDQIQIRPKARLKPGLAYGVVEP